MARKGTLKPKFWGPHPQRSSSAVTRRKKQGRVPKELPELLRDREGVREGVHGFDDRLESTQKLPRTEEGRTNAATATTNCRSSAKDGHL